MTFEMAYLSEGGDGVNINECQRLYGSKWVTSFGQLNCRPSRTSHDSMAVMVIRSLTLCMALAPSLGGARVNGAAVR